MPIIIPCFNRPKSLVRLLQSIKNSEYNSFVDLYISIEGEASLEVIEIAENFDWKFGNKFLIKHNKQLGLKEHIIKCGDLIIQNDLVGAIILEDDLFVSPQFYNYSIATLEFFRYDNKIGGISLYSPEFNESTGLPFNPIKTGSDNYFMQLASSWGQIWLKEHWLSFKKWLNYSDNDDSKLPPNVLDWPSSSWKKEYIRFLIQEDKYFAYPYQSLSTNFGEIGTHFENATDIFQTSLLLEEKKWNFAHFNEKSVIYDSFGELSPEFIKIHNSNLCQYDFETNFYRCKKKSHLSKPYMLTYLNAESASVSFSNKLRPIENNILLGLSGTEIGIIKTDQFRETNLDPNPNSLSYFFNIPLHYLQHMVFLGRNQILDYFPVFLLTIYRTLKKTFKR